MQTSFLPRALLAASGLIAAGIGAAILLDPVGFHAGNDIVVTDDASLRSELRAPGGVLLALGVWMLAGVVRPALTRTALVVGATVYLAYGASRLVSLGLDGTPADGLVMATAFELVLGAACALVLARSSRHRPATA